MNRNIMMARIAKIAAPIALLGAVIGTLATPSMAQDHLGVNARLHDQHARINQGIRGHDLNKYQVHALRSRDRSIHHAEMIDRRHDHGHLTAAERGRLEHRLNNTSHAIYDRKHDVR